MTGWLIWAGVVLAVGTVDLVCWAIRHYRERQRAEQQADERAIEQIVEDHMRRVREGPWTPPKEQTKDAR